MKSYSMSTRRVLRQIDDFTHGLNPGPFRKKYRYGVGDAYFYEAGDGSASLR